MYTLPVKLRQFRISEGLTQSQIAEKLEMTYQEYQKIENGKTVIRADKLSHICKTLNVSADWLLGLGDIRRPLIYEVQVAKGIKFSEEEQIAINRWLKELQSKTEK